ncbi:MAG: hypothetical protein JXQ29_09390 [Planctomycetes bacterium]|nr:hypothetical protein [Planctomycetota bacterium]
MKAKNLPLLLGGLALLLLGGQIPYLAIDLRLREAVWASPSLVAAMPGVKTALVLVALAAGALWAVRRARSLRSGLARGATALLVAYSMIPLSLSSAILALSLALGLTGFLLALGPGAAWASRSGSSRWLARAWQGVLGLPAGRWRLLLFAVGLVLNLAVAGAVFGFRPAIVDTLDQVFQARIYLEGSFTAPAPPVPRAFEFLYMIIQDGRWYSHYPPGHPLLLAGGLLLGASWLVGPVLGALLPLLLHAVARTLWGERTGRVAGLIGLAAPYLHLMAGSHMSHTSCAVFLLLGTLGVAHLLRGGAPGWALVAGGAFGYALIIRPYPALAVAAVAALALLVAAARGRRPGFQTGLLALLAAAPPVVFLLYYNLKTNGHPLLLGYHISQGPLYKLGFGLREMNAVVHEFTLGDAIKQTGHHLIGLHVFGLGTSVPAVLLLLRSFFATRRSPFDALVLGLAAAPVAAFFVYPFSDFVLGPRMVFSCVPFAALLVARGLVRWRRVRTGAFAGVPGAALVILLFLPALPNLAGAMQFNARLMGAGPDRVAATVASHPIGNALVLCDDAAFSQFGFGGLHPALPPDRPVYARDRNSAELVRRFPGRPVYRLAYGAPRTVRLERHLEPFLDLHEMVAARQPDVETVEGMQTATRRLELAAIRDETHKLLFGYTTPATVRFRLTLPDGAFLRFSSIVHPDAWTSGSDGVTFQIRMQSPAMEAPAVLYSEHVGRDRPPLALLDQEVDLGAGAGHEVVLWVEALPGPAGDGRGDVFDFSNLRIVRRVVP